jgi:hypothetical protein
MTTTNRTLLAALATLLFAAAPALADAPPTTVMSQTPGSAFAYKIDFDGSFWNGQRIAFTRAVDLTALQAGAVRIVSSGSTKDDNAALQGTFQKDGSIDAPGAASRLSSFNTIVALLRGAPSALTAGATWTSSIPIETTGQGSTTPFPVTLTVVSSTPDETILQGTGTQTISTTYGGYSVPIDAQVRVAIRLTPNGFDRCDLAATELVHAGPQTQTLSWKWSATRTSTVSAR